MHAYIDEIRALRPLGNTIELAIIKHRQVIVQRGLYAVGSLCIYVAPGSILRNGLGPYKPGYRVKIRSYNGYTSQGLILQTPPNFTNYQLGDDVSQELAIDYLTTTLPAIIPAPRLTECSDYSKARALGMYSWYELPPGQDCALYVIDGVFSSGPVSVDYDTTTISACMRAWGGDLVVWGRYSGILLIYDLYFIDQQRYATLEEIEDFLLEVPLQSLLIERHASLPLTADTLHILCSTANTTVPSSHVLLKAEGAEPYQFVVKPH
nr:Putative RNA ligase [Myoviridae environmental samples]